MIIGGREIDGSESHVVEEIDFIKRNLVSLPPLKQGCAAPSSFLVNDVIYVFGGALSPAEGNDTDIVIGEKLALRENKWREVISRTNDSSAAIRAMQMLKGLQASSFGPASLLYE